MSPEPLDGTVPSPGRLADLAAIQGLAIAYGHAIDGEDWDRWASLFTADARLDYTASGGISGTIDEVRAWLPGAMEVFDWSMHSVFSHEIRFTSDDRATGRAHLFNRNGVTWNGAAEVCDVSGLYLDEYRRTEQGWRFTSRTEHTLAVVGGDFAAMVRTLAESTRGTAP